MTDIPAAPMDVDSVIGSDESRQKLMSQASSGNSSGNSSGSKRSAVVDRLASAAAATASDASGDKLQKEADTAIALDIDTWTMMELKIQDALGEAYVQSGQWNDAKQSCMR